MKYDFVILKKILLLRLFEIALLFHAVPSFGALEPGGAPGAFLRIGVGARPLALGGAFTAIADDINAAYWNPAGLGQLQATQVTGMYSMLSFERKLSYGAVALPVKQAGVIAFDWQNLIIDDFDGRDAFGAATGNFSDSENAFSVSYAKSFGKIVFVGGGFRYISQTLAGHHATGRGWDLGLLFYILKPVSWGCSVKNMAALMEWDTETHLNEKIPWTLQSGIAFTPLSSWLVAIDLKKNENQNIKWCGGMEYRSNGFALRGGYNSTSFTFGGSLRVGKENGFYDLAVEVFKDYPDPSINYRVSFLIQFGKKNPNEKLKDSGLVITKGRIIALKGDFAIITLGYADNITEGDIIHIYNPKQKRIIGKAKIMKCKTEKSAIQIIFINKGCSPEKDDLVLIRRNNE